MRMEYMCTFAHCKVPLRTKPATDGTATMVLEPFPVHVAQQLKADSGAWPQHVWHIVRQLIAAPNVLPIDVIDRRAVPIPDRFCNKYVRLLTTMADEVYR